MTRYGLLLVLLGPVLQANAATGGGFWWNCPGPACPAANPPRTDGQAASENARMFERREEWKAYENMDLKTLRKERGRHELEIKRLKEEERKR
ncbi:MAG: hypothetical protein U1A72_03450 [Sulfuritalea sp.]|nr:hypothetical protein [Sulfuritalea sp.]